MPEKYEILHAEQGGERQKQHPGALVLILPSSASCMTLGSGSSWRLMRPKGWAWLTSAVLLGEEIVF